VEIVIRGDSHYARPEAMVFLDKIRSFHDFRYAARSWTGERSVIARIEARRQGGRWAWRSR
jgi:hypothetical protein